MRILKQTSIINHFPNKGEWDDDAVPEWERKIARFYNQRARWKIFAGLIGLLFLLAVVCVKAGISLWDHLISEKPSAMVQRPNNSCLASPAFRCVSANTAMDAPCVFFVWNDLAKTNVSAIRETKNDLT